MAPPPRGCQGAPPGEPGALFWGGTVPVCPVSSSPAPVGAGALRACWWWDMWVPLSGTGYPPSQRRVAMGDPLSCCAEDLLGGSHPPPLSSPCLLPPILCPPSTKRFSGPFPLCPPTGEGGRGQQLLLSSAFGRTRSLYPDCAYWEAGSPWPLSAEATGQVNTCSPSKKQGVLLSLVHRAATIPLPSPRCS